MQTLFQLNSKGISCYYRNEDMKKIPLDHLLVLEDIVGFDSGKNIYLVYSNENNNLKDYYFEDCLDEVFKRKLDY